MLDSSDAGSVPAPAPPGVCSAGGVCPAPSVGGGGVGVVCPGVVAGEPVFEDDAGVWSGGTAGIWSGGTAGVWLGGITGVWLDGVVGAWSGCDGDVCSGAGAEVGVVVVPVCAGAVLGSLGAGGVAADPPAGSVGAEAAGCDPAAVSLGEVG